MVPARLMPLTHSNAVNQGGSVSGVQVTTEDGGFSNAMCAGKADFFFQNCSQ